LLLGRLAVDIRGRSLQGAAAEATSHPGQLESGTIMTDPELANRTYIEPLTKEYLEEIFAKEKPDALLPTVGGQTALNLAVN